MRVSDVTPVSHLDGLEDGLGVWGAIIGAVANVASAGLQVYSAKNQAKAQESAAKKARAHELALQAAELKALAESRIAQQAVTPVPSSSPVATNFTPEGAAFQPPTAPKDYTMLFVVAGGIAVLGLGAILLLRD